MRRTGSRNVRAAVAGLSASFVGLFCFDRFWIELVVWRLTVKDEVARRQAVERVVAIGARVVPRLLQEAKVPVPYMPEQAVVCLEKLFGVVVMPPAGAGSAQRFWNAAVLQSWECWYKDHRREIERIDREAADLGLSFRRHFAHHSNKPPAPGQVYPTPFRIEDAP